MTNANHEAQLIQIELDDETIDQVSGGIAVAAAITAGVAIGGLAVAAFSAGYTFGKDLAQ